MSPLGYDAAGVLLHLTRPGATISPGGWIGGLDAERSAAAIADLTARALLDDQAQPTADGREHADRLRASLRSARPAARCDLDDLTPDEDRAARPQLAELHDARVRDPDRCTVVGGGLGFEAFSLNGFECGAHGVTVRRLTATAAASQRAWHDYCREHGYRSTDHGPDAPPEPSHERLDELHVTWPQLGDWLARDRAGNQLSFL